MAFSGLSFACKLYFRCFRKIRFDSIAAIEILDEPETFIKDNSSQSCVFLEKLAKNSKLPQWKQLNSEDLGISTSKISKPTRKVLNGLKRKGFEVYLVGGCLRDLILKRTSKTSII